MARKYVSICDEHEDEMTRTPAEIIGDMIRRATEPEEPPCIIP